MISRRHFVQAAMATTALYGASGFGNWSRLAAQQVLSQDDLIGSSDFGNVSLIHITDIHAQTQPIYFREPEFNIGVGLAEGQPPHLVGADFRAAYGIEQGSAMDYALTYDDFTSLAQAYGRMGGLDRISTVVKAIRAERPDALLLDGGDTWQGSLPVASDARHGHGHADERAGRGGDDLALGIHAGLRPGQRADREPCQPAFLGANIFDIEWDEPVYDDYRIFERNGTRSA
jgi:sulfur-oxidizing protein SoxB